MAEWRAARLKNNPQSMRIWGDALVAAFDQSDRQKAHRATRGPRQAWCAGCGKPVSTWRRDRRGTWCSPACKMRHARARWKARQAGAEATPRPAAWADPETQQAAPSAAPTAPRSPTSPESSAAQMDPVSLWIAMHR